ncbi:MAG: 50S ribosomal protein L1 [Candidatus Daviesbacteria bacterium]|nr:50S ribosomal protein L1 [Candidatus Daviesbacteria bacterium]
MGKTKIKVFDESAKEEEKKPSKKKVKEIVIVSEAKQSDSGEVPTQIATATPDGGPRNDTVKKTQKPGKAKPRSKKYQEVVKELDRTKSYSIPEAVDMVKKLSYATFNATIEAHINTAQTGIRGLVSLPYASGKKIRILAFGKGAEQSGASIFGTDEVIEEINKGKVNFDLVVTTPDWMPRLAKVAKILGPKGLMPNPKNSTITDDLKKTVESFQAGKTEYKTESKAPVIHLPLGKLDQPTEELSANIKILLQTLGKTKIKKISLSPTMGPSVKVDLSSI